jgi:hypothetical protein
MLISRRSAPACWGQLFALLLHAGCSSIPDGGLPDDPDAHSTDADARPTADARPGSRPDAAPSSTPDAAVADATLATSDAPPQSDPDPAERLTPEPYGASDFAIGPSDLVVRAVLGTHVLWRCPLSGCPARPAVIAEPLVDLVGTVALAGEHAYFVNARLPLLSRVKLDGTGLESVTSASLYSSFSSSLAVARGRVYVGFRDPFADHGVLEVDAESAFRVPATGMTSLAGEVAAGASWLVYVPRADPLLAARPLEVWSFADGEHATTAPVVLSGTGRALAVAGDALFWAQDDVLRGCRLTDGCATQVVMVSSMQDAAIATDGSRVFFAKFIDGQGAIQSCPALAAACAPRVHSKSRRWLLPKRLRVDDGYIYGIDDAYRGVWRAPR